MVFKTTYTKPKTEAWTLTELMVTLAIFAGIVMAGMFAFTIQANQTLAATANYTLLDAKSQNALDTLTKEVRQAIGLATNSYTSKGYSTDTVNGKAITNIVWFWTTNYTISPPRRECLVYIYDKNAQTLRQRKRQQPGGGTIYSEKILLNNCTYLNFSLFQRNTASNSFNQFPYAVNTNNMKLLLANWTCKRRLVRSLYNTESVQSMRVVLRAR